MATCLAYLGKQESGVISVFQINRFPASASPAFRDAFTQQARAKSKDNTRRALGESSRQNQTMELTQSAFGPAFARASRDKEPSFNLPLPDFEFF
jgi:hypothetical protein